MLEKEFFTLKVGDVLTDGVGTCTILDIYEPKSYEDKTPPYLLVLWDSALGETILPIFDLYDMEHK